MLRGLRRSDVASVFSLLARNFPAEHELLGWDRTAFERIGRSLFRPGPRIVLGFLRAIGRSPFDFLILDEDGKIAAAALLSYPPNVGFLSTVFVDEPFRRRGYAQKLLAVADARVARRGRRRMVLDVLEANAPARSLYAKLGYRRLRGGAHLVHDAPGSADPPPAPADLRPFRRGDAKPRLRASSRRRERGS